MKGDTCKCGRLVTISKGLKCNQCHYAMTGGAKAARTKYRRKVESKASRPRPEACEVCGAGPGERVLHWDHNHGTGAFRGWLCGPCNKALGSAGDNPRILDALAAYLRTSGFAATRPVIR